MIVRGRACMRVCAGSHIDRKMIYFINYDGINKVYHIIYLSFRISLFLTIHIRTYTHTTHAYIYVCVCVCVCVWMLSH